MSKPVDPNPKAHAHGPLPADAEAVERQYGDDADLYARVRAETAAVSGREDAAKAWQKVEVELEEQSEESP